MSQANGKDWTGTRERVLAEIATRPALRIGDRVKPRYADKVDFRGEGKVLFLFCFGTIARVRLDQMERRDGRLVPRVIDVGVIALDRA